MRELNGNLLLKQLIVDWIINNESTIRDICKPLLEDKVKLYSMRQRIKELLKVLKRKVSRYYHNGI